jgi:hypothetical protein
LGTDTLLDALLGDPNVACMLPPPTDATFNRAV